MRVTRRTFVAAAAALVVTPAALAGAKELAGVTMPETLSVAGHTLKLNGMGLRKKALVHVYMGGLYLATPSADGAAIAASDAPRAMRMQFLRTVDRAAFAQGLREGIQAGSPGKTD